MQSSLDSEKKFLIEKVAAYASSRALGDPSRVFLNGSKAVLDEFKKIAASSGILGAKFYNPYLDEEEEIPCDPEDLSLRHLQILARNEHLNVDGVMDTRLYRGLLSDDQIARIRCLVKLTTVSGAVMATHTGGYRHVRHKFEEPKLNILVDQSGLQWQGDFRNTGGMHFYPDSLDHPALPADYLQWQEDMYRVHYGEERPARASEHQVPVTWSRVKGVVDLNAVAKAISQEFNLALEAVVFQANHDLGLDERVNFKFCRAGMGFFLSGLQGNKSLIRVARLQGIADALTALLELPEHEREKKLGKVARLVLPHSHEPPYSEPILEKIAALTRELGLEWGGVPEEDSFKPVTGYVNATTNCADPHAMPGNEGGPCSVDACIAYNANINFHNAAVNKSMRFRLYSSSAPVVALPHRFFTTVAEETKTPEPSFHGPT